MTAVLEADGREPPPQHPPPHPPIRLPRSLEQPTLIRSAKAAQVTPFTEPLDILVIAIFLFL
jgi:hypothetical protein